jgi:hypothetical protein
MSLALIFAILSLILGLMILKLYTPLYKNIFPIVLLSWIGHALGSCIYITFFHGGDALAYFGQANPTWLGTGTDFIQYINWYLQNWLVGQQTQVYAIDDSFIASMFFYGMFAFMGSILWYCIFLKVTEILNLNYARIYSFPALILLCWPSFLIFTAGTKDALCFFFIPLLFLSFLNIKYARLKVLHFLLLLISASILILIRPYLAITLLGALYLTVLLNSNLKFYLRITGVLLLLLILSYAAGQLLISAHINYGHIDTRAALQQQSVEIGSSFPMPSHNPAMILPLLPYSLIMNLCFPLFILGHNVQGMLQSFENLFLVYLIYILIKNYKIIAPTTKQMTYLKLLLFFFLIGMSFLALINTNLGLATREKAMYLPALLIIICLLYTHHTLQKNQKN